MHRSPSNAHITQQKLGVAFSYLERKNQYKSFMLITVPTCKVRWLVSHLWLYYSKCQHCLNSVFLTRFAVFSGESFHADTLISIFLVQRNAFSSVLTGRTVTRRLHKGKDTAVSKDHLMAKSKHNPVTWRTNHLCILDVCWIYGKFSYWLSSTKLSPKF